MFVCVVFLTLASFSMETLLTAVRFPSNASSLCSASSFCIQTISSCPEVVGALSCPWFVHSSCSSSQVFALKNMWLSCLLFLLYLLQLLNETVLICITVLVYNYLYNNNVFNYIHEGVLWVWCAEYVSCVRLTWEKQHRRLLAVFVMPTMLYHKTGLYNINPFAPAIRIAIMLWNLYIYIGLEG